MKWLKEHSALLFAAVFFVAAMVVIYPFYQYYIDPDATAYLTVAKRYAAGDYVKAINGYWSPWSIWLTALLMKGGMASFKAAIIINAIGAIGFLVASHSLFRVFRLRKDIQWMLSGALALFLLYAVFWQSFADLWGCFFLLVVLRLMLLEGFVKRPLLWLLTGLCGALAYVAKAYCLPFFVLEIIVCVFFLAGARQKANRMQWVKVSVCCILIMFIFSFPWIYLLHEKYGMWMTGTAGFLNTSWYLVGHPYWKEGIQHLLPPVYADSPSYWEDVYFVNGITPHFWDSPRLFALQIVRVCYNLLKFVQSINELSAFFAASVIIAIVILFSKKVRARIDQRIQILVLSFLLFPLGYVLINFQGRYLWYMLPLSMIIIMAIVQRASLFHQMSRWLQRLILVLISLSFIASPVLGLKELYKAGYKEHQMAEALKKENITGSFTTNIPYGKETQNIIRLSYFSGNPYYNMPSPTLKDTLLQEMRKYHVKYYFHFYEGDWDNFRLTDERGRPYPEIAAGKISGLRIFLVNH